MNEYEEQQKALQCLGGWNVTTKAPKRKKVVAIKKIAVASNTEAEDLVDSKNARRKSILEKHPFVEFWLDEDSDIPMKLMYRVSKDPNFKPRRQQ